MRHQPSKSSLVAKSKSQQKQSPWACTGLQSLDRDRLAIFRFNDTLPIAAKDDSVDGAKGVAQDTNEINDIDQGSNSADLSQTSSSTNESDSSEDDRSQTHSTTSSDGANSENARGDHNAKRKGHCEKTSQDKIRIGAKQIKINKLLDKIEKSVLARKDHLDEFTRPLNQSLWEGVDFITPAQWHFDSLVDSADNDPVQAVLHKWCMYRNLEERIEQGAIEGHTKPQVKKEYKIEMLTESLSFQAVNSQNRENKRRQFDLYLQQGAIFDTLFKLCPGLMGFIAPFLKTTE